LRDVDRGRQARHKRDVKALHRLVLVASDVIDHLVLLRWVDARSWPRCPRHVWVLPFRKIFRGRI
jgi:hypothetical protein